MSFKSKKDLGNRFKTENLCLRCKHGHTNSKTDAFTCLCNKVCENYMYFKLNRKTGFFC
jgi:hypothetical protein